MSIGSNQTIQEGMWIKGTSVDDERFRGYVEAVSQDGLFVKVRVVLSDHRQVQGRSVLALPSKIEVLDTAIQLDDDLVRQLIDVALLAKDEVWFRELTSAQARGGGEHAATIPPDRSQAPPRHPYRW